jgi:hypothetical protein
VNLLSILYALGVILDSRFAFFRPALSLITCLESDFTISGDTGRTGRW